MKLSTRSRYGLKAMIDLAVYGKDQYISLKSISNRQNLSEAYLEQLFAALKKGGLIKSIRGAQGGYTLASDPEKIKVGTILRVLEGSLSTTDCLDGKSSCGDDCSCCVSKSVWIKMTESLNEAADSISLASLVEDYKNRNHIE